jgi:hypothetical protein
MAGLAPPTDHPLVKSCVEGAKRKLGRPVKPKEPLSLELAVRACDEYIGGASLCDLRFLTMLLLGYAGFLRVD